jgi:hypothetical protein
VFEIGIKYAFSKTMLKIIFVLTGIAGAAVTIIVFLGIQELFGYLFIYAGSLVLSSIPISVSRKLLPMNFLLMIS